MPKTKDQIRDENAIRHFKAALMKRGADEKRFGLYVSKKLGKNEKTCLRYVNEPERLTIRDIRDLGLTDYEILRIVRGVGDDRYC